MTEKEADKLLGFVSGSPAYYNESNAKKLFESIENVFAAKFGLYNSFKYLALIKNSTNIFCLELAYYNVPNWKPEVDQMLSFIVSELRNQLRVFAINKALSLQKFFESLDKIPINLVESESKFDFHNCNKICSDNYNNIPCEHKYNYIGEYIFTQNESPGALGAVVKLEMDNNLYLLTNHHVIIKPNKPLNDSVYAKGICIAKTYWGLNNEFYDIAIAKISEASFADIPKNYFTTTILPKIGLNVSKIGPSGPESGGIIYSSKAIVNIKNRIYKNQILIKGLNLIGGESGTLVSSDSSNSKNVVGLHFGGDGVIDISNNIHLLFSKKIKSYTDSDNRVHPTVTFKSFY
ncbi:MAG: hypothetical protein HRU26_14395 [Psychroserpens sp.]|nr:hypothetical protein [Psychroserpens sp.]